MPSFNLCFHRIRLFGLGPALVLFFRSIHSFRYAPRLCFLRVLFTTVYLISSSLSQLLGSTNHFCQTPPEFKFCPHSIPLLSTHGHVFGSNVLGLRHNNIQHVVHYETWSPAVDQLGRRPFQFLAHRSLPNPFDSA